MAVVAAPAKVLVEPSPQRTSQPVMVSAPGSVAEKLIVYATPWSTLAAPVNVIAGAVLPTLTLKVVSVENKPSLTRTVKGTMAAPSAGVKLKAPVLTFRLAPAGTAPTKLKVTAVPSGSLPGIAKFSVWPSSTASAPIAPISGASLSGRTVTVTVAAADDNWLPPAPSGSPRSVTR